jgi:uncharacterized protein (DUF2141 family)
MRTLLTTALLVVVSAFAKAQSTPAPQQSFTITVTVENSRNDEGKMMFSLSQKDEFMKGAPFKADSVTINDGVATVTFTDVPAGDYAVLVLHDKNGNGIMDFEPNGMPKESYGISNNPMSYGQPTWQEAKITITEDTALKILI